MDQDEQHLYIDSRGCEILMDYKEGLQIILDLGRLGHVERYEAEECGQIEQWQRQETALDIVGDFSANFENYDEIFQLSEKAQDWPNEVLSYDRENWSATTLNALKLVLAMANDNAADPEKCSTVEQAEMIDREQAGLDIIIDFIGLNAPVLEQFSSIDISPLI